MIQKLIGKTPLVHIENTEGAQIYLKLESKNPGGSIKDRPAQYMIEKAIEDGILKEGKEIIEPSSGNMGIALAMIGASLGYRVHIIMPESMSIERRKILKAYGANLILTEAAKGMKGTLEKTEELLKENPNLCYLRQFYNQANPLSHYETTAPELLNELQHIDVFTAGVGTGGTISGVGRYLKEHDQSVRIVAIEPSKSAVLQGNQPGPHKIQGIGAGFIPKIYDPSVVDEILSIEEDEAMDSARELARDYGILAGISSGANFCAAKKLAQGLSREKKVVSVVCDTGERYLSNEVYG